VDAKLGSRSLERPARSRLSGTALMVGLTGCLALVAIALDGYSGRLFAAQSLLIPLVATTLLTTAIGRWAVPILRQLKAGQIIREDGPQAHLKKTGTPTMGGIFFIPPAILAALLISGASADVMAVSALTLAYAAIGWIDDWQILRRKSNKGISPRTKLLLQVAAGGLFCLWLFFHSGPAVANLALPFGWSLPLGLLFWPIAWFALVAESNATNLTDGVDGLAAGTGAIAFLALGVLAAPTSLGLLLFCACMAGGCLGFLSHNRNPAKVFMGDTGSLALGGALVAVALLSQNLFSLLLLSGIFLAETLSVIAQVGYYKATKNEQGIGKRLFKMAPLHHHLELSGWAETKVVGCFYLIGGGLAIATLALQASHWLL
jgi:phospho-N-acetylmuramoyl-pentapeptide-transferase